MKSFFLFLCALAFAGMHSECFGQFGPQQVISVNAYFARSVVATDLNADGHKDILKAGQGEIGWYSNDGSANFSTALEITSELNNGMCVRVSDIDLDGDPDVVWSTSTGIIAWNENDGAGNFASDQLITSEEYEDAVSLTLVDIDDDGDPDVFCAYDWKIAWYENEGDGDFGEEQLVTNQADFAHSIYASDLDEDGDLDILSASTYPGKIAWYENDGQGNFGDQIVISATQQAPHSVFAADMDGDGDDDVLAGSGTDGIIALYRNEGGGTFAPQQIISNSVLQVQDVFPSDLDGDGDLDVISASTDDNKIAWYENDGFGNFGPQQVVTTDCIGAWSVYTADLDEDGDLDIISAGFWGHQIARYENLMGNGCTDPLACNFDAFYNTDDGSCCYGVCGCTDIEAINFSGTAVCEDGSCQYNLGGFVFNDENSDGIWDPWEPGLSNQIVVALPGNVVGVTNDEGQFILNGVQAGVATVQTILSPTFPYSTTLSPIGLEMPLVDPDLELVFGVSKNQPDFAVCVDFYPLGNGYPCDEMVNHNICYRNMGNLPISGIVEVEFDSLFQGYVEVTPIDSVSGNTLYMSFDDLYPGQMFFYDVKLHTPTVDYIGEWLTSVSRIYGFYENNQVAYGESELVHELTCAYDPNDKQVFPAGYADPHYILNETELEYLVRFQNTGNATATHVLVSDTIDSKLDLNTFQLMANSHSVMTSINPSNRTVDFYFENIMLPDSNANEPASHGLISYLITPYPGLEAETEILNTGYIYFDNNPPIVTNTTWNTIYDCLDALAEFEHTDLSMCLGDSIECWSNEEYIESYLWTINDEEAGNSDSILEILPDIGMFAIELIASNPLCEASDSVLVMVVDLPVSGFIQEGNTLIANEAEEYIWYLNGEEIGYDQTLEIEGDGLYSVLVINADGCSDVSDEELIIFTSIESNLWSDAGFAVYPNPMTDNTRLEFDIACANCSVQLLSIDGRVVREWKTSNDKTFIINRGDLSSGTYVLRIFDGEISLGGTLLLVE